MNTEGAGQDGRTGRATHWATREHNERLVLANIFASASISRADLARVTGLTRTTVSDVVTGLISRGLVHEVGRGPSTGGKTPILLAMTEDVRFLVGIDLGEYLFRGALVTLRGNVIRTFEVPVNSPDLGSAGDGERALTLVLDLLDRLVAAGDRSILGIGIGTPGLTDVSTGTVVQAVNLDWRDLPLGALLRERYGVPVCVANDVQVTALAEHVFGGPHTRNLALVKLGAGISAGLILDGRLYQGDGFGAGEIGHTAVVDGGPDCRCGSRGCLEAVASTRAIVAQLSDAGIEGGLAGGIAAFEAGDARARRIVGEAAQLIGTALAWLVGVLSIHRIVLVGGLTGFGAPFVRIIEDTMRRKTFPRLGQEAQVTISGLGENGVVLGASSLLLTRELGLNLAGVGEPSDIALAARRASFRSRWAWRDGRDGLDARQPIAATHPGVTAAAASRATRVAARADRAEP